MPILDKLEKRFHFIGIPQLLTVILVGQGLIYAMSFGNPQTAQKTVLHASGLMQGEWWRALTFALSPIGMHPLFALFYFQMYWMISRALSTEWGDFKVTLYVLAGLAGPLAATLAAHHLWGMPLVFDSSHFVLPLFLAFAFLYPEYEVLVMFILPMKMRWIAWLTGAWILFKIFTSRMGANYELVAALGGFLNYILFFWGDYYRRWRDHKSTARARSEFRKSLRVVSGEKVSKKCHVCGKDNLDADIRLCTCVRCGDDGKFWCPDDLHDHVKKH